MTPPAGCYVAPPMGSPEATIVTVIGGGLAGCEAAWQLAEAGERVRIVEMKPGKRTAAQRGDGLAELVCSNSLRSANPANAVGLLKDEMRRLGSLVMAVAAATRVPAGDALAVDRERFSQEITRRIAEHPGITRIDQEATALPAAGDVIVATGPLTADALAADIQRLAGSERLFFYDALAPIVAAETIARETVFAASRYDKGDGSDYLNCPLDAPQYDAFIAALLAAETMALHPFESPRYFEGCLPVEVVAARGAESLRYGCMKPVGLTDPRTGRWPHAVVQLRREDAAGQAYNLVGFQTKMTHPEQRRVLRMIPGLEGATFLRLGAVHRNTYLDSPTLLDGQMRLRAAPHLRFAGQITGVEGYVESSAHGLITARLLAAARQGRPLAPPPPETALGCLLNHVTGA